MVLPVALTGVPSNLSAISCTSTGNCTAIGYDNGGTPLSVTESGGSWGSVADFSGAPVDEYVYGLSCPSAGNCIAVGNSSSGEPLYFQEAAGQWGAARTATGFTFGGTLPSISCTQTGVCTSIGYDNDHHPVVDSSADITGISFGGSVVSPTVTITGSGFGTEADLGTAQKPCGPASTGSDFGGNLTVDDTTAGWNAGASGSGCSYAGLKISSYSANQVVLTFGSNYPTYGSLVAGNLITVSLLGTSYTLPVAYVTVSGVSFSGTGAGSTVTVTGSGFGSMSDLGTPMSPCGSSTGNDFGGNLTFTDSTRSWAAGDDASPACDQIGLVVSSYSSTQIAFAFGSNYSVYGNLLAGDSFTLGLLGTVFMGTVGYPPAITSASSWSITAASPATFSVTTTGYPAPTVTETGALPPGIGLALDTLVGTPTAAGDYQITLIASNGVGAPATQSFDIMVNYATPSLPVVSNLPSAPTYGDSFVANVATTGDGAVSVTTDTPYVCSVSDLTVSFVGVGGCTLTAHVASGAEYNGDDGQPQNVTVGQAMASSPSVTDIPAAAFLGGSFDASVSTTGDGPTGVTSSTPAVCTTSGDIVSYVGVGTCTLNAHVGDGTDYLGSDGAPQSFDVLGLTVTTVLPDGTCGVAYGPVTLQASGISASAGSYVTTLKWKKVALPKGLKLTSAGVLSGTPSLTKLVSGSNPITVKVTETVTTLNGTKKIKTTTTVEATVALNLT